MDYHTYNQQIVCVCSNPEERQLMIPNDGTGTIMCLSCQKMWHMCPAHPKFAVQGPGNFQTRQVRQCSCFLFQPSTQTPPQQQQQHNQQFQNQNQNSNLQQIQPSNHPPTFNPNNNPNEFKEFGNTHSTHYAQFDTVYQNNSQTYRKALEFTTCPTCKSKRFQETDSQDTTLVCLDCKTYFHPCLVHGVGIKGPGYPKTSVDVYRCSCPHKPFDNNQWKSPFL